MLKRHLFAIVGALLLTQGPAYAWRPDATKEELALLPRLCDYVEGGRGLATHPEMRDRYIARYGQGWIYMHHYCYTLVDEFRLQRAGLSDGEVKLYTTRGISNLDFVLRATSREFAFRPDILARRAKLIARTGNLQSAADAAKELIAEFPKYPDGYVILADVLLKNRQRDAAREVIARGDTAVEDKARYDRLKTLLDLR